MTCGQQGVVGPRPIILKLSPSVEEVWTVLPEQVPTRVAVASSESSGPLAAVGRLDTRMRCSSGKWFSQPNGGAWQELTDPEVSSSFVACTVMDPQPPLRPAVQSCSTLATIDVLVPLGVRFRHAPSGSSAAAATRAGNMSASCRGQTPPNWWAGIGAWFPTQVLLFIHRSPSSTLQSALGAVVVNSTSMSGTLLASVGIDPDVGEATALEVSRHVASRTSAHLSVSRDSTAEATAWPDCAGSLVAAAGHSSLRVKLQIELSSEWLDQPFTVVAAAGAGSAQSEVRALAFGMQSSEFVATSWSCRQLPFNVVAPHALKSGSAVVQSSASSSRLAIGSASPNAEMQFALPSPPAAGETLVVGCQSTVSSLRFDHSRAAIDADLFAAGGQLHVSASLDSSEDSTVTEGDVLCSFTSTSASLATAAATLQEAQSAMSSSQARPGKRGLHRKLSSAFPEPPPGARFATLQPVSVLVRLVPTLLPRVRDVLVRQEGEALGNTSSWRSSALSQVRVLLNPSTALPSAIAIASLLGPVWETATSETAGLPQTDGVQLASSGSSEIIMLMRPGSFCLGAATRVLVGAAEGVPLEVAPDGSAMRLRLPKQAEACNSSRSGAWGLGGSWVELRLQSQSEECGWQGITILPDGRSLGDVQWTASVARESRIQPLCQQAAQRLDLVADGGKVTLCLVGVEPSRLRKGGYEIDLSDAQSDLLPQAVVDAGYEWSTDPQARTLRLASGAPLAQALAVYFVDQCEGFEPPGQACVDGTATLDCAHGTGDACRSCSSLCPARKPGCGVCPGGFRVWPAAGFWVRSEAARVVAQCVPPAERRCLGWDVSKAVSRCGQGFMGDACSLCSAGYFPDAVEGCAVCPPGSPLELLLTPLALYGGLAFGLAFGSMLLFGTLQCAASDADRQEALVRSRTAEHLDRGDPPWRARRAAEAEVATKIRAQGSVPRVACARSMAGRAAGRAAQLGLWSVLSLQTLVQVSRSLAKGVPDVVARAFSTLSIFELSPSVAVHPRCLSLPELTVESSILIAVLSLTAVVALLALAVSCEPRPESGARIMPSTAASMLPRVFAAASVSYVLGVNTIVAVLHCIPDTTVSGSDWTVMASNPYIRCGSAEHARAWLLAVPAAVCVAFGLPVGTWLFVRQRSAWLLTLGITTAGASGPRIAVGQQAGQLDQASAKLPAPERRPSRPRKLQDSIGRPKAPAAGAIRARRLRRGSQGGRARSTGPHGAGFGSASVSCTTTRRSQSALPKRFPSRCVAQTSLSSTGQPVKPAEPPPPEEEKLVLVRNPMLDARPMRAQQRRSARSSPSPARRARTRHLNDGCCCNRHSVPSCLVRRKLSPSRLQAPKLLAANTRSAGDSTKPAQSIDNSNFVRGDAAIASCVARDFRPSRAWHIPAGQLALLAIGCSSEVLVASPNRTLLTVLIGSAVTTLVCCIMAVIVTLDQPYALGHSWKRWLRALTLLLTAVTAWLNLTQLAASGMLASPEQATVLVDPDAARAFVGPLAFTAFGMSALLLVAMAGAVFGGLGRETAVAIACERCAARACRPPEVAHAPVAKPFGRAIASGPSQDIPSLRRSLQAGRVSPLITARRQSQPHLAAAQFEGLAPLDALDKPVGLLSPTGFARDIDCRRDRNHGGAAMTRVRANRHE